MTARMQTLFWIITLAVFFLFVWLLRSILLPFVLGIAIAYFLDPVVGKLVQWKLPRAAAATIVLVLFFGAGVAGFILVGPIVFEQIVAFVSHVPDYYRAAVGGLTPHINRFSDLVGTAAPERLNETILEALKEGAGIAGGAMVSLVEGGISLIAIISLLAITPLVALYLMIQWPGITARIDGWLPRQHAGTIRDLMRQIDVVLKGYVNGSFIIIVSLIAFYATGLSLMGLQYGLTIGLLAGAASFIPYLGTAFGLAASVGMALYQFWPDWVMPLVALLIFVAGQVISDYILTPRIMGDKVQLHPLWVIFGVFACGSLFGFVGMVIAVPITAVAGVLLRFFTRQYEKSPVYLGTETGKPKS